VHKHTNEDFFEEIFAVNLKQPGSQQSTTSLRTRILLLALETRRSSLLGNEFRASTRARLIFLIAFLFALIVVLIQK
jgi:hypothetical protein